MPRIQSFPDSTLTSVFLGKVIVIPFTRKGYLSIALLAMSTTMVLQIF
jgi:hypothetical protein